MDRWIHLGLLGAWLGFGLAAWLWWRRRHSSKHYTYPERAAVINDALKQSADLGIVYWSRSAKQFQRRIVTPLELDGYSLKAFDHTTNDVRIFKVTRIRTIQVVPRGSTDVPGRAPVAGSVWALAGLAVAGGAMLGIAMYRSVGPVQAEGVNKSVAPTGTVASSAVAPKIEETKVVPPRERWEVVVDNNTTYDTNQVAEVIAKVVHCSSTEAEGFLVAIISAGHASVWQGEWVKAETIRQALEAEDVDAHLQPAPRQ